MAKLSYYFAVSLDGYIARTDDRVDWLDPFSAKLNTPYDFEPYTETVSATVIGRKTFETSLELGPWHFGGKPSFIYTRQVGYQLPPDRDDLGDVAIVTDDVPRHLADLKSEHSGRIWLLGGGDLAAFCLAERLLDELVLNVMPVTIGDGIPWLARMSADVSWTLREQYAATNGVAQLVYDRAGA